MVFTSLKHGYGSMVECPCVGHADTHRTTSGVSKKEEGGGGGFNEIE